MAFGDTIQSVDASFASGEVTINFAAATAGNLLVVMEGRAVTHSSGGAWGPPAGWAVIHDSGINVGNVAGAMYYKIAAGGETSFVTSHTNEQGTAMAVFAEIEGPYTVSPLDVSAENTTNLSTAATSQSSGTTGTTSQADELAIAGFASDRMDTVNDSRAYSNGFTEIIFADINTARATAMLAKKVLSATGTVECTFSVTDTGDEMYGVVATFKKQTGGGSHDLTATGVSTGTPTVDTPAIGQVHVLSATGVDTGSPSVGSPTLTQIHVLSATGVEAGIPTVGTPAIGQVHALSASGVDAGTPTVGSPSLTQVHYLTATGVDAGTPTVGSPAIGQVHQLTATGVATGAPTVGAPTLGVGVVAPPAYVIVVPSDPRRITVAAEARVTRVPAESRVIKVMRATE